METPVPYQLSKVLEKAPADWRGRYCALVPEFLQTRARPFLGEDVTSFMREREVGEPPDANAWGAMFNATIAKSGFAIRTGRTRLAKAGKSHAHAFREWQSTMPATGQADDDAPRTHGYTVQVPLEEDRSVGGSSSCSGSRRVFAIVREGPVKLLAPVEPTSSRTACSGAVVPVSLSWRTSSPTTQQESVVGACTASWITAMSARCAMAQRDLMNAQLSWSTFAAMRSPSPGHLVRRVGDGNYKR